MTATSFPDLEYADPEPPPHLLEGARSRGRQLRRRRRTGSLASGAVAALLLALGGQAVLGHGGGPAAPARPSSSAPAAATPGTDRSKLPASTGHGPSARTFTKDGYGVDEEGHGRPLAPPAGPAIVLAPATTGAPGGPYRAALLWLSKDASVVLGSRESAGAKLQPSSSTVLDHLPAEGLWGGAQYSDNSQPPNSHLPVRTILLGLVRGPVTRVVIGLPDGEVTAHLAPASDPRLGTFYWVVTNDFDVDGDTVSGAATALTRTVYRGTQPVFRCEGDGCLGPH
jgi:hypothetical protein